MWVWMDRIGIIVFDATLSTAVFLTFIVLAMLGCRQPARRILLARVALLAALAILPLVAVGRLPRLYVIDTFVESRLFPRAVFLAATPTEPSDAKVSATPAASEDSDRRVSRWISRAAAVARSWLPRGLTLLDMGCVALSSAWLFLGLAGVQWLIYRSRPPSPATQALFDELVAGRSWAAARAGVRVCSRVNHPVVTGLFRPTILIPEALDRGGGDLELLRLSLLHEIAHAERSDHWFSTAASIAQAVWFFLPHVWWIRSQLLIDQEYLADRSAAAQYGTSSEYASSLLSLAVPGGTEPVSSPRGPTQAAPSAGKVGVQSPLFQRMMMLLHCPYPVESRTPRVWSWTSRLAVIMASIAAACLVIRWPHASLAVSAPRSGDGPPTSFRVSHFRIDPPHEGGGNPAGRVYVMPVTLPARFELDVEVRCNTPGPAQVRLAGQLIGIPGALPDPRFSDAPRPNSEGDGDSSAWHHVHLHRAGSRVSVVMDGRSVSDSSHAGSLPGWLTIEANSEVSIEFRGLVVTW